MQKTANNLTPIFYDMAIEASAALRGQIHREIPGVKEEISESTIGRITKITIFNEEGATLMGRPCGTYITLDQKNGSIEENIESSLVNILSGLIGSIMPHKDDGPVLICGIGNGAIAADALGKKTVARIFPTRHLFQNSTLTEQNDYRSTAQFCPNVLGNTGMEAAELIQGVCRSINPCFILVIDALATSSASRLTHSFQLNNNGLVPGGGIGNTRPGLDEATLGAPVIAIGVPTVIYPHALIREAVSILYDSHSRKNKPTPLPNPEETEKLLFQKMQHSLSLGAVTPKDIDTTIDSLSRVLAGAILCALHPAVHIDNYQSYFPI